MDWGGGGRENARELWTRRTSSANIAASSPIKSTAAVLGTDDSSLAFTASPTVSSGIVESRTGVKADLAPTPLTNGGRLWERAPRGSPPCGLNAVHV